MNKSVIVSKFGGTSMADLAAMRRSAVISKNHKASIVVVSAVSGVTNLLIKASEVAISSTLEDTQKVIQEIDLKHNTILNEMEASSEIRSNVENLLQEVRTLTQGMNLLKECSVKAYDSLLSLGERLSSTIFAQVLKEIWPEKNVEWFDVRKIMITNDDFGKAVPNIKMIETLSSQHLMDCKYGEKVFVTQGFIGATEEGFTTVLGRGGSDYSAALVAEGIKADVLQIWTDVAGIATTDPRIVPQAKLLDEITYSEAAELATFGAKILHPTTLTPALRANVAVFVGSSYEPEKNGTWIKTKTESSPLIRAMAKKDDQVILTLSTPKMLNTHGFLYEVFRIFKDHKISIDSITTSEISVALTIENKSLVNKKLIEELSSLCEVKTEENLSLISLIGNDINHTPNLAARIFKSIEGINVRMICLGASKHNFCFLVNKNHATECIQKLHQEFIG